MNLTKLINKQSGKQLVNFEQRQYLKNNKNIQNLLENSLRRFSLNQHQQDSLQHRQFQNMHQLSELEEKELIRKLQKQANYDKVYQKLFDDGVFQRFMVGGVDQQKQSLDEFSLQSGDLQNSQATRTQYFTNQISNQKTKMQQASKDLQKYVEQQHVRNKNKLIIPLALGELYRDQILERWLPKRKDNKSDDEVDHKKGDLETKTKEELKKEEEDDDDAHFDDWQGVERKGHKTSSSDSDNDDDTNENKDDDDDQDGGVMMPIPM